MTSETVINKTSNLARPEPSSTSLALGFTGKGLAVLESDTMKKHSGFTKGSGCYKCTCCGKMTRDDGNGDSVHCQLCTNCNTNALQSHWEELRAALALCEGGAK